MRMTKTESAILAILSDGNRHSTKEIIRLVFDEFTEANNIHSHMRTIRMKLPVDETIVSEFHKGFYYRWVFLRPGAKK